MGQLLAAQAVQAAKQEGAPAKPPPCPLCVPLTCLPTLAPCSRRYVLNAAVPVQGSEEVRYMGRS